MRHIYHTVLLSSLPTSDDAHVAAVADGDDVSWPASWEEAGSHCCCILAHETGVCRSVG